MGGKVMVCATCKPAPDNCTACALAELLSALSARVNVPANGPLMVGARATAIKHCAEEDSCVLEEQSVRPEGTCVKVAVSARFETVKVWLPALETVRVCGALVEPT